MNLDASHSSEHGLAEEDWVDAGVAESKLLAVWTEAAGRSAGLRDRRRTGKQQLDEAGVMGEHRRGFTVR